MEAPIEAPGSLSLDSGSNIYGETVLGAEETRSRDEPPRTDGTGLQIQATGPTRTKKAP